MLQHLRRVESGVVRHRHEDRAAPDEDRAPHKAEQPDHQRDVPALIKMQESKREAEREVAHPHAAQPLAKGTQEKSEAVVVWTNLYGKEKTRVFCTTIGGRSSWAARSAVIGAQR